MQDRDFSIQIGDFLTKKSNSDTILFSDKFSTMLPQLSNWISCSIHINSGDEKTVLLTFSDVTRKETRDCDVCWAETELSWYINEILIKWYKDYDETRLKEDEISFSSRNEKVDVENILYELITSKEPVRHTCTKCGQNDDSDFSNNSQISEENSIKRTFNK